MTILRLIAAAGVRLSLLAGAWVVHGSLTTPPQLSATVLVQKQAVPDLNTLTPAIRIISLARP